MTSGTEPITEIATLAELEKRATPGPWHTGGIAFPDDPVLRHTSVWGPREHPEDQSGRWIDRHVTEANAKLICAMRNALPKLLARIAELEAQDAKWREIAADHVDLHHAHEALEIAHAQQADQLSAAREALRPFAAAADALGLVEAMVTIGDVALTSTDFRRARALLADSGEGA